MKTQGIRNAAPEFLVTLPPPTPNGGLHVGHMAGPFLAADFFIKSMLAKGHSLHVLSYSDTNQSYVRATAEKQNRDPAELASYWTRDIVETLKKFKCTVDDYFEPDASSNAFVRDAIQDLYARGRLKRKEYGFFYAPQLDKFLDEAGVSGNCPECLDDCKCGICEACGFINSSETLLNPYATNDPSCVLELRPVPVMVLELEAWREELRLFHVESDRIRPKYRWLVNDALFRKLPDFPMTVPGSWGISVGHPAFPNQVINAWPEIALDFVFGYKKVLGRNGSVPRIVNFFGYDNSYFYALVHVALLHAMEAKHFLPYATVINEFYNLENAKFSTSRGHLIWAKDIIETFPSDLVRFYLALSAPGFEQGNFSEKEMRQVIQRRLAGPYTRIAQSLNLALRSARHPGDVSKEALRGGAVMVQRVAKSFTLERFDLRHAAEDALHGLMFIERSMQRSTSESTDHIVVNMKHLLSCWARCVHPIMPVLSDRLSQELDQMAQTQQPLTTDIFELVAEAQTPVAKELADA